MPFKCLAIRTMFIAIAAAWLCLLGPSAFAAPPGMNVSSNPSASAHGNTCASRDGCIEAILGAARAGRHIDQLLLTARLADMHRPAKPFTNERATRPLRGGEAIAVGNVDAILTMTLQAAKKDYAWVPQYRRALVLTYFRAGQMQEAERELREAIGESPAEAPFWADLAIIFHQQGKIQDAVSALIVADSWAQDAKALRTGYERAAQTASIEGMEQVYREGLQAIAENAVALEQFDAGLPTVSATANHPEARATISFDKCEKPEWPRSSLRYEETGKVTLAFFVDADGKLLRAKKLESSGYVELDNAAFIAMSSCTFRPAYVDGKPMPAWARLQYLWTLE